MLSKFIHHAVAVQANAVMRSVINEQERKKQLAKAKAAALSCIEQKRLEKVGK